jgi:hypothetical protein
MPWMGIMTDGLACGGGGTGGGSINNFLDLDMI